MGNLDADLELAAIAPVASEMSAALRIRLASSDGVRSAAGALVRTRYAWRRYLTPDGIALPGHITLVAEGGSEGVVGTLTLVLDGPEGLLCERAFPVEVARLRGQGARLCEITRFAIKPSGASARIMGALFHIAYLYGHHLHGATAAIMECNPRHVSAHARLLGFSTISEVRTCPRAGAPAVLMHVPAGVIESGIDAWAGRGDAPPHSAFRYFFPRPEEEGILRRVYSMRAA